MAWKKHSQPTDRKETEPTSNATIATARGTTSPNAGPKVVTKKDSARPAGLITITAMIIITVTDLAKTAIITAAAATGTTTGTTTPTITQTLQTRTSRHGQRWNAPRLPSKKSMTKPTFPRRLLTARAIKPNSWKLRSSSTTLEHLGTCPPSPSDSQTITRSCLNRSLLLISGLFMRSA